MTKRFLPLLCVIAVCFALLCPIAAQAVTPLEPDREASLTLRYEKEGVAFPDLQVCLYRVANAFPEGIFRLIPPYSGYPIHIHDISDQGQWKHIASTLCACITADQLPPDRETVTDAEGVAPIVLDGVSLEIEKGSFVAILGHNGSGKSTMAKHLNAILLPTEGTVWVGEKDTKDENEIWNNNFYICKSFL